MCSFVRLKWRMDSLSLVSRDKMRTVLHKATFKMGDEYPVTTSMRVGLTRPLDGSKRRREHRGGCRSDCRLSNVKLHRVAALLGILDCQAGALAFAHS